MPLSCQSANIRSAAHFLTDTNSGLAVRRSLDPPCASVFRTQMTS